MRAAGVLLVLTSAACIDLDAFSASYVDAGAIGANDLAQADAGPPSTTCELGMTTSLPLVIPAGTTTSPALASMGHNMNGTFFVVGVIDMTGVLQIFQYEAGTQNISPISVIGCAAGPCTVAHFSRTADPEPNGAVALFDAVNGQIATFAYAGGAPTSPYSFGCPSSSPAGDAALAGSFNFGRLCDGGDALLVGPTSMHNVGNPGAHELRVARAPGKSGYLLTNDTVGTTLSQLALDSPNLDTTVAWSGATHATGLGLDAIDLSHALGAGVDSPGNLHLFVISPEAPGMHDRPTSLQAAADVAHPVAVAAGKDRYVVAYRNPAQGALGVVIGLDGQPAAAPFPIAGMSALGVQVAGDPGSPLGVHGAFVAAWLEPGATPTVKIANVSCP